MLRDIPHRMWSYDLQSHDLDVTPALLDYFSSEGKRYFQGQIEGFLIKEKSSRDCQFAELNEEICKLYNEATLLKSTISDFFSGL